MTELYVTKAIVKLPRKTNRISSLVVDTTTNNKSTLMMKDYIVTDKLYFDGLSTTNNSSFVVTENEIMDLVRSCDPIKIYWNRNNDMTCGGYIQFINRDMADRAYTLFNGVTSRSGIRLQLKINPPLGDCPEPEAQAGILNIKNLPLHINNSSLYELFRPFGPMTLCRILLEQGSTFKGTALVQYFDSENAHHAEISMNNKAVQENHIITVFPFVSNKKRTSCSNIETSQDFIVSRPNRYSTYTIPSTPTSPLPPPPQIRSDGSSMVDYTNLYIKNLDLNVKSADLFNNFRKFGRIISARVMKNAQTKQSKGFGFVSFSKADEAQKAKQDMNGEYILSKPVIVAFHEPKKPKDLNGSTSPTESTTFTTTTNTYQRTSPPPPPIPSFPQQQQNSYINHSTTGNGYYQQQQQQQHAKPRDFIDHRYNNTNTMPKYTNYNHPQQQQQDYTSSMSPPNKSYYQPMERNNSRSSHHHTTTTTTTTTSNVYDQRQQVSPPQQQQKDHFTPLKRNLSSSGNPSLSALASGAFINTPPTIYYQQQQQQQQQQRPTFRRRGSVESMASVMTETSSQTRRHTITKAVLAIEKSDEKHVHDIVDMLLTLKKKDLATCLFNKAFLKLKIKQAKDALDIFQEQQQNVMDKQDQLVPPTSSSMNKYTPPPPRPSRAIPIVAPPSPKKDSNNITEEIEKFLSSLNGLTLHKKKQALGDRLFPLVKSTGVKQAPRITIRLLDTIPLEELAYSMYDKEKLKVQVDQIVAALTTSSTATY